MSVQTLATDLARPYLCRLQGKNPVICFWGKPWWPRTWNLRRPRRKIKSTLDISSSTVQTIPDWRPTEQSYFGTGNLVII